MTPIFKTNMLGIHLQYFLNVSLLGTIFSINSFAHDGVVNITGSILPTSCSVVVGDQSKLIKMGDFSSGTLTEIGQKTPYVPLTIAVENCSAGITGAVISISGDADQNNENLLQLNNYGSDTTASGVAVLIADSKGSGININSASNLQSLNPGNNTINLQLAYEVTTLPVKAGDASSVMYLDLSYQ